MISVSRKKSAWKSDVPDTEGLWWLSVFGDPAPALYVVSQSKRGLVLWQYSDPDERGCLIKYWPKDDDRLWMGPFDIPDTPKHHPVKKPSKYKDWAIHYWDHSPDIEDHIRNIKMDTVRARNKNEAIRKLTQKICNKSKWFRLRHAQTVDNLI